MRAMRQRRRMMGYREVRLVVPDARSQALRREVAAEVARLNPDDEKRALDWIEAVSEFDDEAR
jgi:hypothetical protein